MSSQQKPITNNVDIAMQKVREMQSIIFDKDTSPNKLFQKTQQVIIYMEKASQEIKANYEEISRKLTEQMNTGKVQK